MFLHLSTAVALAAAIPAPAAPDQNWQPPLAGPVEVIRPFRPPPTRYSPGHRGVDLAARTGDPVLAAGAGRISFAGQVAGRGVVVVAHPGGLRTSYEPVEGTVQAGAPVAVGARLGTLGSSAHCPVACLHWGLRRGTDYLDPMTLLDGGTAGAVRLLPLDGTPVSGARPASCAGRASPWSGSGRPGSPRPRRARPPRPV